jgi:DNA-binding transcriptional regulator YdaS (Cro superfamily)
MAQVAKIKIEDAGLREAIQAAGTKYRLAKMLGISPASVQTWKRVPVERIVEIERLTGVARHLLRPELYS